MSEPTLTDPVDQEIYEYLNPDSPKAFFLFAGAGSGKTRSLVNVLKKFRDDHVQRLRFAGQKVAIITYTNAACDEIKSRLEFDATFDVSTIHSFAWNLIKPYGRDIKDWLNTRLEEEIAVLEDLQSRGKAGSKAAIDRPIQIETKKRRIENLKKITRFIYSPDQDGMEWNSLNHAEVIAIAASFLSERPMLRQILICSYPILLIDESQDTNADLMDAFFTVHADHSHAFTLGLFGDRVQRIFLEGKKDLGEGLPENWARPAKTINYRCPKRVINLINKIRLPLGDPEQTPAESNTEGFVRLFMAPANSPADKPEFEKWVQQEMAIITGDEKWSFDSDEPKILILEHLMAARRGGFDSFFHPLYKVDAFKTGLLNGKLPEISLFAKQVLPLMDAIHSENKFEVARLAREHSPLLNEKKLKQSDVPLKEIKKTHEAVQSLAGLWDDGDPKLGDILQEVHRSGLFLIPEKLLPIAKRLAEGTVIETLNEPEDRDPKIDAWDEALKCSFKEFRAYVQYISDQSRFGTHQGIKGRQFPNVMVILDDEEAGGTQFKYERLLGADEPSATDIKNQREGKETTLDRTRRLFYVTCSRAEKSLAVVAYTKEPSKVKQRVVEEGWFNENEVISTRIWPPEK